MNGVDPLHTPRSVAVEAALEAGRVLRGYIGRLETVLEQLQRAFPDYGVLAEESGVVIGEGNPTTRWIVDPLDGTTNFANGYPHFCVSIALERNDELHLGVVYVPMLDELFIAEKGQGAWMNGERLAVSREAVLRNSVLSTGFEYAPVKRKNNLGRFAYFTETARAIRRDGSATIDLCYVAAGRFDGFWEAGLNPWDVAAGALMVREAGGSLTDYVGNEYRIDAPGWGATNGHIHAAVLSGIQKNGARMGVS